MGLIKKVMIADPLSAAALYASSRGQRRVDSLGMAVLIYAMQLYFDFSGYSDMALGLARMFSLRFRLTSILPSGAAMIEYWQRLHMSLTRYLTLYLYNPIALAVARRRMAAGRPTGTAGTRTAGGFLGMVAVPIFITMGLAGVWHGAGLQFLIFGCLHAFYLIVNHAWRTFGPNRGRRNPHGCKRWPASDLPMSPRWWRKSSSGRLPRVSRTPRGTHGRLLARGRHDHPGHANPMAGAPAGRALVLPEHRADLRPLFPSLTKIRADSPLRFTWWPGLPWAIAFSLFLLIDFLSLGGTSEFLYFRF